LINQKCNVAGYQLGKNFIVFTTLNMDSAAHFFLVLVLGLIIVCSDKLALESLILGLALPSFTNDYLS
jgi:hypothetical protein